MNTQECKVLDQAVRDLSKMAPNLPFGITIRPDYKTRNLLVANDKVGFAVTWEAIKDERHKTEFKAALGSLIAICGDPIKLAAISAYRPPKFSVSEG